MQPNTYQQKVYDEIASGTNSIIVEAVAGSGKTTTIVNALNLLPQYYDVMFCAFNKHIATELQTRVPSNTRASTLNSIGYGICRKNIPTRVDVGKVEKIFQSLYRDKLGNNTYYKIRGRVTKLVSLFKAYGIVGPTQADIDYLLDRYDFVIDDLDFVQPACGVLAENNNTLTTIDFDDQIYFPVIFGWPTQKYDYVFVDEAQDLNPVQIELIKKIALRTVFVGDSRQAIYGFRGADPQAMQNIEQSFNSLCLPLSICYRCAKKIVLRAQKIVPTIEFNPSSPEGEVKDVPYSYYEANVKEGDYVLCRTMAPLVSEALRMIRNKRKAVVRGRQIGENLLTLIEHIKDLDDYEIEQRKRIKDEARLAEFQDQIDTIKALLEAYGEEGISKGIGDLFSDNAVGIIYSTIHRSKGLETNAVWILEPQLLPHPSAKKDWQILQEHNLEYIAVTRAKMVLNIVRR